MKQALIAIAAGLVFLCSLFFTMPAKAEQRQMFVRMFCDSNWEEVFKTTKKYEEEILFSGKSLVTELKTNLPFSGSMFFSVNQEKGTWSMITIYVDGTACMTTTGTNFQPYFGEQYDPNKSKEKQLNP